MTIFSKKQCKIDRGSKLLMEVGKTMQNQKYKVLNNTLFEVAQSRSFTDKDNLEEKFNEQGRIVLVSDRVGASLTLSIAKNDDVISFLVKWDDSEEYFRGWNMAWEEFQWCLDVVNTKPKETEATEATEATEVTETTTEATEVTEASDVTEATEVTK
ncbi:homoserine dehydrogenase [Solibacillus sp. FSL H8-0538]|uniref:homoserine dehydrogenase n=1 Tax=Solibacillus sp. FSL H8-0538 TaxID=2921400 RepID=UPI0030FAFBDA